ncbi:MAG: protease I [Nitrospinae bacterium]|jgi:protease I|nr:protease I [Nitrospinota bacterium]|tara:strand:+ start:2073 stop:2588 length:516 start_codon:yes stop_codon:yes gene_type:complete
MKKALILTGNLAQDHEFIYPFYRVQEEGYEVDVAVRGGEQVNGIIGSKIVPTKDIPELEVNDYALLVLPGGAKAMEYMRQDQDIIQFISDFNSSGKTIASICHAAQLLISAKIVKGKKISGYYSIKDDINNAGAIYTDEPAVVDGNIISTAHYKDLGPWMKKTLEVCSKDN